MASFAIVTGTPSRLRRTPPAKWPREKEIYSSSATWPGEYPEGGRGCLRTFALMGME